MCPTILVQKLPNAKQDRNKDIMVFCDVTPCSMVDGYQPFGRTCCLHLSTLKMEVGGSSKTSVPSYHKQYSVTYHKNISDTQCQRKLRHQQQRVLGKTHTPDDGHFHFGTHLSFTYTHSRFQKPNSGICITEGSNIYKRIILAMVHPSQGVTHRADGCMTLGW